MRTSEIIIFITVINQGSWHLVEHLILLHHLLIFYLHTVVVFTANHLCLETDTIICIL